MSFASIGLTVWLVVSGFFAAAVLFFERKNPASSLAWVLVLLFLPGVGLILYLFLGTGFRINRKKKYVLKAINDNVYQNYLLRRLNLAEALRFVEKHEGLGRLIGYLNKGGGGFYTSRNQVQVYTDGRKMFDQMIEDLKAAEHHIHMLSFIFNNDRIGREIAAILTRKAQAGVEVRLLYDSVGSRRLIFNPPMLRRLRRAGGQVLGFSPVFSNLSSHLRVNYRNHRKITVVDGRLGYVGGMNIGDEYLGRKRRLAPWRDTHLRMAGPAVWFLQDRFIMDWSYTSEDELNEEQSLTPYFPEIENPAGEVGVQIVSSGPDTYEQPIKSGLLSLIYAARRNIYIQSPYFTAETEFLDALRIAARSDVDVRLMIPAIADYGIVHMATLGFARQALEAGVRVFLYHGFLHAKTMVSDGLVTSIGTANLTSRSFFLDFEITAFMYSSGFASEYESIFLKDQENSTEITREWFSRRPRFVRGLYNVSRLLAPLI